MTDSADVITNLTTAFYGKFAGSDFSTALNGQLFEDEAPEGTLYPYAVYMIISAPKEKTFTEEFTNLLMQLSIFSSTSSSAEIKDAYYHAHTLYDECALEIIGSTLVWMKEINLTTMIDEITTPEGTTKVRHYAIDFEILTSLN